MGSNGVVLFHAYANSGNLGLEKIPRDNFQSCVGGGLSATESGRRGPVGQLDYIMRFENLADDFRAVCAALDIQARQLPRYKRSTHDPYSKCYDVHLRELVREGFAAEIEQFGYTFD